MNTPKDAKAGLDEIICDGVALDVFHADQARLLLEELDGFVERINQTGVGKRFFANLQIILERDLVLSLARLYERYSPRNPGRTLCAAIHHIATHAASLQIPNRKAVLDFLARCGVSPHELEQVSDQELSLTLVKHLESRIPQADLSSTSPLDQALARLKTVRDTAIAHHDAVSPSSLLIPGWPQLVTLIDLARETVMLIAGSYLSVGYGLENDARQAAGSLRRLMHKAGLGL